VQNKNAMDKILLYLRESYNELMDKVSWPTRQNLIDSAKVVVVSALMLSVVVFVMDFVVNQVLTFIYSL
jgi:preprotein translocase subunit SecE